MYIKKGNLAFTTLHGNAKISPKEASINGLLNRTKQNAKRRKISFSLTREEFVDLIFGNCVWCGCSPSEKYNVAVSKNGYTQMKHATQRITEGWIYFNGIDRIDSSKGYETSNVQSCCKFCNFAKNDRTDAEFKLWIQVLSKRWYNEDSSNI